VVGVRCHVRGNSGDRKHNKHTPCQKDLYTMLLLASVVGTAAASMAVATSGVSWTCARGIVQDRVSENAFLTAMRFLVVPHLLTLLAPPRPPSCTDSPCVGQARQ
jgi:hypothetical protein